VTLPPNPPVQADPAVTVPPQPAESGPHRLNRSTDGRLVGGVAHGLARHLGVDPWVVRLAFVLLAVSGGAGVAAYAAFWALVPLADEAAEPVGAGADSAAMEADERAGRLGPLIALCAVAAGALLILQRVGFGPARLVAAPFLVVGLGVVMLWRVADDSQRARWRHTATVSATGRRAWVRVVVGVMLVVVGAGAVLGARGGLQAALDGLVGGLVVVVGVAVVAGPWLIRNTRELTQERRERIRSQERAELAAHVHDSVVQTLTLIQRSADDPRVVVQLARAEERALRQWLYRPGGADPGMFRAALDAAAADVEDAHGGAVEVVAVGDAPLDDRLGALIQAAKEAMVNAVKYASDAGPVSVYAELEPTQASVFVRDRGPGFDLDAVPQDRLGVRQSIIGRMERHGGRAQITSGPGEGAEVHLTIPRVRAPVQEES
jgi:signal transduction histidine kinase/phage shock protein PspC (stress-responsive transcriptional regulator)